MTTTTHIFISLLILGILLIYKSNSLKAQVSIEELESKTDSICTQYNNPNSAGLAISIAQNGEKVFTKCYGMADLEHNVPVIETTVFDIASLSKPLTALGIALLVQQDKIEIDDEIITFLPNLPECYKGITIKHLLFHTSGIRDWVVAFRFSDCGTNHISMDDLISWIYRQQELNFSPGEKYSYCNSNYNLLAFIITKVTDTPFPQWMKENIFDPLDMKNTHVHDNFSMIIPNRAESYTNNSQGEIANMNGDNLIAYGSSSVFTTIEDLSKWANNYSNWKLGGTKIKEFMFQKGMNDKGEETLYNCNGFNYDHWGVECVRMAGGWAGYGSLWAYFPQHNLTVVSLSNHSYYTGSEMYQVADLFLADYQTIEKHNNPLSIINLEKNKTNTYLADRIIGNYEFLAYPGAILNISMENKKLYAEISEEDRFEIFVASDSVLFNKDMEVVITHNKTDNSDIQNLIWNEGGEWKVVRVIEIPEDKLQKYVGSYYSSELETTYKLYINNKSLYAGHYKHGDHKLIPISEDCFSNNAFYFENVSFEYSATGKISGFRLSVGDLENILFIKK